VKNGEAGNVKRKRAESEEKMVVHKNRTRPKRLP
jgi:hypothetical protein